jgi:hypothetical protein
MNLLKWSVVSFHKRTLRYDIQHVINPSGIDKCSWNIYPW